MNSWLFDTLVYTGLLIGLVLLVRRPAGRLFGPQFAYALWALPFLRLLMPPIVLPASFRPDPTVAQAPALVTPTDVVFEPVAAVAPMAAASPVSNASVWELVSLGEVAASIWLGGALAFLAWRIVTYRKLRRDLLDDARPVGEVGRIRLVETPALSAPVAFGVMDKVIAMPPQFMAQHDLAARDLAIAHELAHHRGHDLLANFAAQALLGMHWFNPLAWLGWRAMRRDQEAACDARVLAGRGREERAVYATLIANVAAGPRLALVAPMACPMLGERSIVHRLRSLSMNEVSGRRRWIGRGLIATTALALPLTASFSYAADVQEVEPIAPPAPVAAPLAPEAVQAPESAIPPVEPVAPVAPEARTEQVYRYEARTGEPGVAPQVRHFTLRREGGHYAPPPAPPAPMPHMPNMSFDQWGRPSDPDFEANMEAWGKEMEKWGEEWGEKYAAEMERYADEMAANAERSVPEVVESCDPSQRRRTTTSDGRQRIVICSRDYQMAASSGLRQARASIARNRSISEDVRNEILSDLDKEIRRIESE